MHRNDTQVEYREEVVRYFNDLIDTLFDNNYFGCVNAAKQYVLDMKVYIEQHIAYTPRYVAPPHFDRYGKDMQYFTYCPNRLTTWYIFFRQQKNRYLICYISNNHIEGQYINYLPKR